MVCDFIQQPGIDSVKLENNKEIKHLASKIVLQESINLELKVLVEKLEKKLEDGFFKIKGDIVKIK